MSVKQIIDGREVELTEVADLQAIHVGPSPIALKDRRPAPARLESEASDVASETLTHEDREVFAAAGWLFTRRSQDSLSATAEFSPAGETPVAHRLLLGPRGECLIETPRATVQLDSRLTEEEATAELAKIGLRSVRRLGFGDHLFEVMAQEGPSQSLDLASRLRQLPLVEFAEGQVLGCASSRLRPADPQYAEQWQWPNIGAEEAWDRTRGAGVRIAIVDLGMDVNHPDLKDGIEGGGYFRAGRAEGSDFVRLPRNRRNGRGFPDHPHGTLCMSLAGARINDIGGCGGAPESTLVPIAAMPGRLGTQTDLARAIAYAVDPSMEDPAASPAAGADVISCSLEAPQHYALGPTLELALDFAVEQGRGGKGTLIFWAVPNSEIPVSSDEICSHPATLAVGRSSRYHLSTGTAYGPELDFLAPGLNVAGSLSGGKFGSGDGSSYATPCAAAVAALVLSLRRRLGWREVRDRLRQTCDKVGGLPYEGRAFGGRNSRYGYGRINAAEAVDF